MFGTEVVLTDYITSRSKVSTCRVIESREVQGHLRTYPKTRRVMNTLVLIATAHDISLPRRSSMELMLRRLRQGSQLSL